MGKKSSEFWVLSERRINKAGRFEVRSSRFSEPRNSSLARDPKNGDRHPSTSLESQSPASLGRLPQVSREIPSVFIVPFSV